MKKYEIFNIVDEIENRNPTIYSTVVNDPSLRIILDNIICPPKVPQPSAGQYPEFVYVFATCKYKKDDIAILIKHLRKLYRKMCKAESLKKEVE